MSNIENAIEIACMAHKSQTDKANSPYIFHPLRLMLKFDNEKEMIIAVLHDVIEDSDITLSDLKNAGFSDVILQAINALTKRTGEEYFEFIKRILKNPLAIKIKIEDINDNLNLNRIKRELSQIDLNRINKYRKALILLRTSQDK